MNYTIKRSKRKTLCLMISREGEIIVRAPWRCSKEYIDRFVRSKQDWIDAHFARVQAEIDERARFTFADMDTISFCGRELPLVIDPEKPVTVTEEAVFIPSAEPAEVTGPLLLAMGEAAYPWLKERLDHWSVVMGLSYSELKLSSAVWRWGSCSHDGIIRISRILLLAPLKSIDYVLIHELAHRKVHGHNPEFYGVIAPVMPDWKKHQYALRVLNQHLRRQGFIK